MIAEKNLTLSVVIPCYNEESSIAACLDALIRQKDDIDEIIIVDNNSTDKTIEIAEAYSQQYPLIRLIFEKEQGLQPARNRGLNEATGAILARIDADTVVEPGWAKNLKEYYGDPKNENVGAASGSSWFYDLPFRKIGAFALDKIINDFNRTHAGTSHSMYGANMSLRRDAWKQVRGELCTEPNIMEDMDVGYHVMKAGYQVGYMPDAKAGVSGRRMRMSPLRYWRYNQQWWMAYRRHGLYKDMRRTRVLSWAGNVLQALIWVGLLFHNPKTNRFSLLAFRDKQEERSIP